MVFRSSLKTKFSDMDKFRWWKNSAMILMFFLAVLPSPLATGSNTWQKPGCHKVGEFTAQKKKTISNNNNNIMHNIKTNDTHKYLKELYNYYQAKNRLIV